MDGGVAVEERLDVVKIAAECVRLNQPSVKHRTDVLEILAMASFDLGKGLGVEVIVIKGHAAFAGDIQAAAVPSGKLRDEVGGAREFNIELKLSPRR